jgi:regulator of sigma E protease
LIFTFVNMVGLPVLTPEIGSLQADSAAMEGGLKAGDRIIAMDGKDVNKWDEISEIVTAGRDKPLRITVLRDTSRLDFTITPRPMKTRNLFGEEVESFKIGISPSPHTVIERRNPCRHSGRASVRHG